MPRRQGDGGGLDRQRTQRIVGTVVVADLVDGQRLENVQAVTVAPVNHLVRAFGVADAQVLFRADGKDRLQDAGQGLVWTQLHHQALAASDSCAGAWRKARKLVLNRGVQSTSKGS